jgi:serine/threonine-protein kinase RsbW
MMTEPRAGQAHAPANSAAMEIRIPARAEWVRVVRLTVAGIAGRMGFTFDEVEDIKLAVAEACNNAILHAGADSDSDLSGASRVQVEVTPHRDRLDIRVTDEGSEGTVEFPAAREATQYTADEYEDLPEGGMGLLLIRSLMDEVQQHSGPQMQTTLRMVKYLQNPPTDDGVTDFDGDTPPAA